MSKNHIKTASLFKFTVGINAIITWHDDNWANMLSHKWKRNEFWTFSKKKSVLRKTLNKFRLPNEPPIEVAYGDGRVAATAKGELSVPTKYVKDLCCELYPCVSVDEYMTSSVCVNPECEAQLHPIYFVRNGFIQQLRGMKWCNSTVCRNCPFKHRDFVGSGNIYKAYKNQVYNEDIPALLDRDHPFQQQKLNTKLLENQYRCTAPHTNVPKFVRGKKKKRTKHNKRQRRYARDKDAMEIED